MASDFTAPPGVELADILATSFLFQRSRRAPNFQGEAEVLLSASSKQALGADTVLDELLRGAMALCRAGSAGISVVDDAVGGAVFRWTHLVGVFAQHVGGSTPRDFSPCGVTLALGAAQLFRQPARYFTYFGAVSPGIVEGLVVPFAIGERLIGTMWIVSHDPGSEFDAEDARVVQRLGIFAGSVIEAHRRLRSELEEGATWRERAALALDELDDAKVDLMDASRVREDLIRAGEDIRARAAEAESRQRSAEAERLRAERAKGIAEALVKVGQALASELDPSRLPALISHFACRHLGVPIAAFAAAPRDATVPGIAITALSLIDDESSSDRDASIHLDVLPVTSTTTIPDIRLESREDPAAERIRSLPGAARWRSALIVPVRSRSGALLGELVFAHGDVNAFAPHHGQLAQGIAAIAADALDNSRLFGQEREMREIIAERERLARLSGEIARALIAPSSFEESLHACCEALNLHLDAAFVRIWLLDPTEKVLVLTASAGMYTHLDGGHARIPMGSFKIGRIAKARTPHVSNHVTEDPEIGDRGWAVREGMVAFAGYPLIVGDHVLGVIGLFARHILSAAVIDLLASVSVGIAANIDRRRKEVELDRTASELRQSNRDLERFVGVASHDLIEPTRTIGSFLTLFQSRYGQQLDERGAGYIRFAREGAERMARLITSLLAYAKIAGVTPELSPVCLDKALDDALSNLDKRIQDVGAVITRGPMPTVLGDLPLLGQLFQNLLANALKFSRPGVPPAVAIHAHPAPNGWRIEVTDNGIGIPVEARERIFEMFQRLHTQEQFAGSGVGLATCRRIVEHCRGRISVESAPGEGARFVIELPRG